MSFLNDILYFPYLPGFFTTNILFPWTEWNLVILFYIFTIIFTTFIIICTTYFTRYLIKKIFSDRFHIPSYINYISILFLIIPIINIIYPIILGASKNNIQKQLKFIFIWVIFSCFYIFSKIEIEYSSVFLSLIIPFISLLLISVKIQNKYLNIFLKIIVFLIL